MFALNAQTDLNTQTPAGLELAAAAHLHLFKGKSTHFLLKLGLTLVNFMQEVFVL